MLITINGVHAYGRHLALFVIFTVASDCVGTAIPRTPRHADGEIRIDPNWPECTRALFPLPESVQCGSGELFLPQSTGFSIQFSNQSKSLHSVTLQKAFERTRAELYNIPLLVHFGAAEPGTTTTASFGEVAEQVVGSGSFLRSLTVTVVTEDDGTGIVVDTGSGNCATKSHASRITHENLSRESIEPQEP